MSSEPRYSHSWLTTTRSASGNRIWIPGLVGLALSVVLSIALLFTIVTGITIGHSDVGRVESLIVENQKAILESQQAIRNNQKTILENQRRIEFLAAQAASKTEDDPRKGSRP